MTKFQLSFVLIILTSFSVVTGQNNLKNELSESFKSYSLTRLDPRSAARSAESAQFIAMDLGAKRLELRLTPNDLRAPGYIAEDTDAMGTKRLDRGQSTTYKGAVAGEAGSRLRMSIDQSRVEGYFVIDGETYFVQPASDFSKSADADQLVVYRLQDLRSDVEIKCGNDLVSKISDAEKFVSTQKAPNSLRVIELGTEADYAFVQSVGSAAESNAKILSILNMVEGLYEAELGLTVRVVLQHTFSTQDGYSEANAVALLDSFRLDWEARYPRTAYPRDAAHLFTYKPNVRAQGYAFIGTICDLPQYAYGLTGRMYLDWNWESANFLITSHEMGHNVGANHCESIAGCQNAVMRSPITGDTQLTFCSFSRGEIGNFIGTYGACLTPARSRSIPFDFDGDGKTDSTIFRPSDGTWFINNSGQGNYSIFQFGINGDVPVGGDFDGDGKADPAVFRNGVWWRMKSSDNTFDAVTFGLRTDVPAAADFDGDGKTDVAVFRPETGIWHMLKTTDGSYYASQFGLNGDVPMPADYDGDGKADLNVFRPSNGVWYRTNSANGTFFSAQFGMNGDKAMPGDFDGDGKSDMAVYRPSNGTWYAQQSGDGTYKVVSFGLATDRPLTGDYDGDGKTDIAVWRPSTGVWHRLNSSSGGYEAYPFGISSDIPVQGR